MAVLITVVVTTYNRSDMLRGCLESLSKQTLDKDQYEIVVVDNNSSDDTRQIVDGFLNQGNIRYCVELQPGLSHARNRGLQEAKGTYIAYIDDDGLASPDWLEVARGLITSIQPAPDCFGGPIFPFYTSQKPAWFDDKYEIRMAWDTSRYLKKGGAFSGSNMIWAKEILIEIGGFNTKVGVEGNKLRLGSETATFDNLWRLRDNARLYFSPALIGYHWVPDFKMTVSYRVKRKFAEAQYQANRVSSASTSKKLEHICNFIFYLTKAIIRSIIKSNAYPYWQNWVVEEGGRIALYSGNLLGVLGIQPRLTQANK